MAHRMVVRLVPGWLRVLVVWVLVAGAGGCPGATTPAPVVTLASDGAWTWFSDPRALFHRGALYFGYVRQTDGRAAVSRFDPQTGARTTLWASELNQRDDHFNPALVVREDGTLLALMARHGADAFFAWRASHTADAAVPADWLPEQRSGHVAGGLTYACPTRLAEESHALYNFCRGPNYTPLVLVSTDGGTNWSAPRPLIQARTGVLRPYLKFSSDDTRRIDFVYTEGHPRETRTSLYHAYYERGQIHRSDGTELKAFDQLPLWHDAGERGSAVYQYRDTPAASPDEHIPHGRAWCWDVARPANGPPACVFSVQRDAVGGTNWWHDRIYYYYAHWTGTHWEKRFIAHAGRPLYEPENDFAGGICLDPEQPGVVYLSSNAEAPFDLADLDRVPLQRSERYELYRGVSTNGGQSFVWTALTRDSTADNLRPCVPRGHGESPAVLWLRGDYTSMSTFNCAVVGWFPELRVQPEEPGFDTRLWRTEDGLPHNSVQAVVQTRDGYLWAGTRQGLVQFDGLRFQRVMDLTNLPITALVEEQDGTLWVGTDGAGVWQRREGRFRQVTGGDGSPDNGVKAILAPANGPVLIVTTNGLSRLRNDRLVNLFHGATVHSVCESEPGEWLLATAAGLMRCSTGAVVEPATEQAAPVRVVARDARGGILLGSARGLERYAAGQITPHPASSGLGGQVIQTLCPATNGTLWVGTASGLRYLAQDGTFREIRHDGESFDLVNAICEDREGNLWAAARDGLHRVRTRVFTTLTKQHGLANNDVTSVLEDAAGKVWIGTWGGGLHVLSDGVITRVKSTNAFFNELVLGLAVDRNSAVWIGTDSDGGMFRYERGQFVRYWRNQGISSLADPGVRAIHVERRNRLWVGSRDALNVAFRGQSMRRYTTQNGMAGNGVRAILEDRQGNVWIGTGDGLTRFVDDPVASYTREHGLSDNEITALYEDAAGVMWIGTAHGGVNRFQQGKFTAYDQRHGLFSNEILEIVEDDFGRLWMTCRNGVFWVAKEDFAALDSGRTGAVRCVSYGKDDGLLTLSCSGIAKPGAWKSRDGRLWFATVQGLSVVDPRIVPDTHSPAPPVVIQQVSFAGKEYPPEASILLPPGRGELAIHFTTLSFRGPERARFQYQLAGVDAGWVDAGNRRTAYYNHLTPGHYRFRVKGCNSDGVWNEAGATLALTLQPNFWQTWWFRLAGLLGAGLLVAAVYQVRVARIRELERLRLRIATDLHDEIGSSMGSISLLTRKIQKESNLAEPQRGDLASITRISAQAASSIRDIVWFVNPEYDTTQDLLARMKDTAHTMLGGITCHFSGPQEDLARKLSLDFRRNIFLMFKEILGNIVRHSQATEVDIVISRKAGTWELVVDDNGVGFDAAAIRRGNGLENMQRRANRLGGTLTLRSRPGRGTTVIFTSRNA